MLKKFLFRLENWLVNLRNDLPSLLFKKATFKAKNKSNGYEHIFTSGVHAAWVFILTATFLTTFYLVLLPVYDWPWSVSLTIYWQILIFVTGGVFTVVALNFRSIKDRTIEKIQEEATEEFDKILSSLTQTNTNVAALHINPGPHGGVSESLLRHFDDVLKTKETVSSLVSVIQARQHNVSARVGHIKEDQQRVRRAVTAAGGGVFTGFFTFEVGDSVMKFTHLIHGQDDRSMFFWLKSSEIAENPKECHHNPKECKYIALTPGSSEFRDHFKKEYQQSELHAYSVLLAVTLLVSLVAALIGWRKPAEEQSGGHGGHH